MIYNQLNDKFSVQNKQNFETTLQDKGPMTQDTCKDRASQWWGRTAFQSY
jgi:hypothetical protein